MLVNAILPFISVDVWYRHLPNNPAVLTVGTKLALFFTTAHRLRLTTINKDSTRLKETIIHTIKVYLDNYSIELLRNFRKIKTSFSSFSLSISVVSRIFL